MYGLLKGLRVLDLTRLLPGGYATQLLGDLGAEVLKVEDPWQGDYMRWMQPHFPGTKESSLFWGLNRNKKSITLNLKSETGKELFLDLVKKYDVVIEGFRPGVMEGLGLGYGRLKEVNPRLIMCSISGYGQDGPYRLRAGHDINYIALAGILGLTGKSPEEDPVIPPVQLGDIGGGALMAVIGILAAYISRQKTGRGQYVDVSMLDGILSWLAMLLMEQRAKGPEAMERGRMLLTGGEVCYNVYRTKDGKYLSLGALEPKFWEGFCRAVGREDLIKEQFSRDPAVKEEVVNIFLSKTREEWEALLADKDICCEPVLTLEEAKNHPQLTARQMFRPMPHPQAGPVDVLGPPLKFTEETEGPDTPPPGYGADTEEVLIKELGLSRDRIKELKKQGII
ncbi:MAG: CoA transferase [Clostridia bacterium]|nr:CoA transferase [Clostridia bacterium]